ncbi:UNVERIFIED_CONTAM: hypothetical protein NCL1_57574 [Trichonephila clavipes]
MTDFPAVVYIKASRLDNSAPKLEDVSELNVVNPKKKIKGSKLFTVEKDNESLKSHDKNYLEFPAIQFTRFSSHFALSRNFLLKKFFFLTFKHFYANMKFYLSFTNRTTSTISLMFVLNSMKNMCGCFYHVTS